MIKVNEITIQDVIDKMKEVFPNRKVSLGRKDRGANYYIMEDGKELISAGSFDRLKLKLWGYSKGEINA